MIGDDGTSRTVTDLVSGEDEMFEIIQTNADNYIVNKNHILSLQIADHKRIYWDNKDGAWIVGWYDRITNSYIRKQFSGLHEGEEQLTKMKTGGRTGTQTWEEALEKANSFLKTIDDDNVLDISVADYLKLSKNTKRKLYGFRCSGVNWPNQEVYIDPYLLGLWLGYGISTQPTICNVDDEIVQFLTEYCDKNDFKLTNNPEYITYTICETNQKESRIVSWLNQYNLIKNKHIPREYLVNDRKTRLEVLAGIIDTDSNVTKEGRLVRISQCLKHKQLRRRARVGRRGCRPRPHPHGGLPPSKNGPS